MFPSPGPGATSQGVKPLERPDNAELPEDQPHGEEEIFQEAMEHFHEMVRESETRTSADVPVQDDMNIEELAEGLLKRASEPASGATSSAEPPTSRPRVGPPPSVERISVRLRMFLKPLRRSSGFLRCLGLQTIP